MAGFFEIAGLEERKRALAAESEIYRETLKLEVQNLRLYGVHLRRRLDIFRPWRPLAAAAPLLIMLYRLGLFGRRRNKPRGRGARLFGAALFAWRLFRNYGPMMRGLLAQLGLRPGQAGSVTEEPPFGST